MKFPFIRYASRTIYGLAIASGLLFGGLQASDASADRIFQNHSTLDPIYENYRSEHGDQLFLYQGILDHLAGSTQEIARALKPFDHIVLTNGFPERPTWENGNCVVGPFVGYQDGALPELLKMLRNQNPNVKIYGYIPATADNVNGCWSNEPEAQNYLCPNGRCKDAIKYVQMWQSGEYAHGSETYLDGFFIDLFNVFYAHEVTLNNLTSLIHGLENSAGDPYKVIANVVATESAYYYSQPDQELVLSRADPITIASELLRAGDSIFVEGISLKAGKIQNNGFEVYQKLKDIYNEKQITWMVSDSEITYIPPYSGRDCSIFPSVGGTAQISEFCAEDPSFVWLTPPQVCQLPNQAWTYANFRYHAPDGGIAYTYGEAGLGTYSEVVPFCPHSSVE